MLWSGKTWQEKLRLAFWILVLIGAGLVLLIFFRGGQVVVRTPGAYQSVFLDNGQVYFGKLSSAGQDFISLKDVYYLRASNGQAGANPNEGAKVDLVKLEAELHQPKNEMIINRSHVLFYEDMGEGSEITKLIRAQSGGH